MTQIAKKAIQISDGLASIAHKRMKSLVSELQKEGVLSKSESQSALKRVGQVKTDLYDKLSKELKKVLVTAESKSRKSKSKRKK